VPTPARQSHYIRPHRNTVKSVLQTHIDHDLLLAFRDRAAELGMAYSFAADEAIKHWLIKTDEDVPRS
jgi:hypothetical protein